uniref:Uncharacterized protein n=1 Tax=Neogobius melanostomus TaxID=47308 RepID=A0A8C6SMC5_9GOBI
MCVCVVLSVRNKKFSSLTCFCFRDEFFAVQPVLPSDVIHAPRKDVPCIFKVGSRESSLGPVSVLVLADSEQEQRKWLKVLESLHGLLKQNLLLVTDEQRVERPLEVYDPALPIIKSTLSAAILDRERVVLGTEEALFVVDLTRDVIVRASDTKKVHQIELVPRENLVVLVCGRTRQVHLQSWAALDGSESAFDVKLTETKGCQALTTGTLKPGTASCLITAVKRQVSCWELTRSKPYHRRLWEVQAPGPVQWLGMVLERICVGFPGGFALLALQGESSPVSLVWPQDPSLVFLSHTPLDALHAAPLSRSEEILLCFSHTGVYVDHQGRRSRTRELMWAATPTAFSEYYRPHSLSVYTDYGVDIYDLHSSDWLQTLPLRPLNSDGSLNLLHSDPSRLIYLQKTGEGELLLPEVTESSRKLMLRTRSKRKFLFKLPEEERQQQRREMLRDPGLRSKMISGPTNFNHISHMGPGDGMQILRDLPLVRTSLTYPTPYTLHPTLPYPTPYTLHPTHYTLQPTHYTLHSHTLHPTHYTLHSHTLHHTPYTLHTIPYTLHPTPYTLYPTHYTLHSHTLHPTHYTLHTTPYTLHPTLHTLPTTPYTLHPTHYTLHPTHYTLHTIPYTHIPYTLHPTPYTLHPTHYTLHQASQTHLDWGPQMQTQCWSGQQTKPFLLSQL